MILLNHNVKAFLAVVKHGTVSEAGKQIGLTQTAVTQRIRSLEKELGVSLFIRSKSGMQLTDEGALVHRHSLSANDLDEQLSTQVRQLGTAQDIEMNIGGMASMICGRVIPQITAILKKWPHLHVNFHIESHDNRLGYLKSGKIDLAVMRTHEAIPELETKELRPIEFKLLASAKWKGRKLKEVLKNEKMITYSHDDIHSKDYLEMYDLQEQIGRKKIYTNEGRTFQRQLENGLGFGLLPSEIADPALKSGKIIALNNGRSMKHPICLAWYRRPEMPEYMRQIVDKIQ